MSVIKIRNEEGLFVDIPVIQGEQGATGEAGQDGVDGSKIYSSPLTPENFTEGIDGDWYIRTTTYDMYEKVDGEWVVRLNLKGPTGENGASVNVIQATDENNAITLSQQNPNNIYYWSEE